MSLNELVAHIVARNAEARARAEARGAVAFPIVEDGEFWAERGITTVAEFDRSMAISEWSDSFKAINGVRPRWSVAHLSTEEIEKMTADLWRREEEAEKAEAAEKARVDAALAACREAPVPLTHRAFATELEDWFFHNGPELEWTKPWKN